MVNKKQKITGLLTGVFIIIVGVFYFFLFKDTPENPVSITGRLIPYACLVIGALLVFTVLKSWSKEKKAEQISKENAFMNEEQEIKDINQPSSALDTTGIEPQFAKQFKAAYRLLSSEGATIVEDKKLIHYLEDKFATNHIFSHNFGFAAVLSMNYSDLRYYILFVKIAFPYPSMRYREKWDKNYMFKQNPYRDTEEYQVWGFADLNRDCGKILIREKEFEDNVDHFLARFNDKSIATEALTRKIIGQFTLVGMESDINRFLNQSIIQRLPKVNKEIRAVIDGDTIMFGIPHNFSVDKAASVHDFFRSIQSSVRSNVE